MLLNKYALAIKLVAIGLLVGGLLIKDGQLRSARGERDVARIERDQFKATAEQNGRVIEGFAKQRVDNDAIATAVAAKLNLNRAQTEKVRVELRKAQDNDATVRDWAVTPIPDLVQRLLNEDVTDAGIPQRAR
jgi:hypothetical protein